MATDLSKRLDEETRKATAARVSSPEVSGAQLAAGGVTFRPAATPALAATQTGYVGNSTGAGNDLTGRLDVATKQGEAFRSTHTATPTPAPGNSAADIRQPSPGIPSLYGMGKSFEPTGTASPGTHPAASGLTLDPAGMNTAQRSAAAFAYSQGVDRMTGTGPGLELTRVLQPGAEQKQGVDFGGMQKRIAAYGLEPSIVGLRNEREGMLGSGIKMATGPAGGLTITGNGLAANAVPGGGASSINMQEGNDILARANAVRQSMIDTPEVKAKLQAEAERNRLYDARYQGQDPTRVENDATLAKWDLENALRQPVVGGRAGRGGGTASAPGVVADMSMANAENRVALAMKDNTERRAQDRQVQVEQQRIAAEAPMRLAQLQGQQLQNQQAISQQSAQQQLAQALAGGDPAAISQARTVATAAGIKLPEREKLQTVQTDNGLMVFDPVSGQMRQATDTSGHTIAGTGKALTEYQGKSTGFGMRAAAASQVIDKVGQGGKVQPSLLKRAAEAVPLVGEGLGMVANRLASPEQQQIEQVQRDFINAVLRQESGAAISDTEFDNARKQYFPQPGDSAEVIEQKRANRETQINGFRISAGPGAQHIGGASGQSDQPVQQSQQQQGSQRSGGLVAGYVDDGHVFLGGNPNDPANWVEVRK